MEQYLWRRINVTNNWDNIYDNHDIKSVRKKITSQYDWENGIKTTAASIIIQQQLCEFVMFVRYSNLNIAKHWHKSDCYKPQESAMVLFVISHKISHFLHNSSKKHTFWKFLKKLHNIITQKFEGNCVKNMLICKKKI